MVLYDFPTVDAGADQFISGIITTMPSFTGWFLFFVYGVVFLSGSIAQKNLLGFADIPFWSLIASISCVIIILPLTLKLGFVQIEVLGIVVAITLASAVWFFLDRNRNEV